MKRKGRARKLTDEQVKDLREIYADKNDKRSISQLARVFRVSPVTADNVIMKRGAYKDPGPPSTWSIEVLCYEYQQAGGGQLGKYVWQKIRPSGGAPYQFNSFNEAAHMANMCYGGANGDTVRIVKN